RGWAFPTGLSLNEVAAHDTVNPGDPARYLHPADILKIDFGVHVEGNILDSAFSVSFDPVHDELMRAVQEATETGIRNAGPDAWISDISSQIHEVMESGEVHRPDGKVLRVKTIKNLTGHMIGPYKIHAGKSLPSVNTGGQERMLAGELWAVETFGSVGGFGYVGNGGNCSHFMRSSGSAPAQWQRTMLSSSALNLLDLIDQRFGTLAFCPRWILQAQAAQQKKSKQNGNHQRWWASPLDELCNVGVVNRYPPLADLRGSFTAQLDAQYEHTILLGSSKKEVMLSVTTIERALVENFSKDGKEQHHGITVRGHCKTIITGDGRGGEGGGISTFMGLYPDIDVLTRDRNGYVGHPYAFRLFAVVVGNLLIFKMNAAYQRYWEAAGALQSMAAKWLDGACMAVTFDAGGDSDHPYLNGSEWHRSAEPDPNTGSKGGPDHAEYVQDVLHLCSLLHAVTLQHLRRDGNLDNLVPSKLGPRHTVLPNSPSFWSERSMFSPEHISDLYKIQKLPVLGGLRPEEKLALQTDSKGQELPTCARAAMVEGWFMRRLIGRQKFEQGETSKTSPPILSRLYQVISDGTLWSYTAAKSSEIPFPFPYQNFVEVMVWLFSFLAPVVINGIIFEQFLRTVASFTVVLCFHTLKNTSDVME
ncbi:METAP2, partial [Symbiodinium pilosum]